LSVRILLLFAVLSPLLFRWVYSISVSWLPGLIWFVESGLFLIGFACFFALPDWTKPVHMEKEGKPQHSGSNTPMDTEKVLRGVE